LQEVASASNKRFKITEQGDPLEFLSWLLNSLHRDLGGTRKPNSSRCRRLLGALMTTGAPKRVLIGRSDVSTMCSPGIVYSAFQGELRVDDQPIKVKAVDDDETDKPMFDLGQEIKTSSSPFLFLAIDLPPMRVFQDATDRNNIIPQVPISEVLRKFNGETTQETAGRLRRYKLTRLPPFLILHIKRFTSNNFVEEKNPTIINFPLKGIDLSECIERPASSSTASTTPSADDPLFTALYDLVANVTHESTAGTAHEDTTWKSHVHTRAMPKSGQEEDWYQIQDLIVEEINKQMVFLGESYIQVRPEARLTVAGRVSRSPTDFC
jgi:U4/U6.U5 tri-snRNP-associated protein 2